jgi:hypothetical protein
MKRRFWLFILLNAYNVCVLNSKRQILKQHYVIFEFIICHELLIRKKIENT